MNRCFSPIRSTSSAIASTDCCRYSMRCSSTALGAGAGSSSRSRRVKRQTTSPTSCSATWPAACLASPIAAPQITPPRFIRVKRTKPTFHIFERAIETSCLYQRHYAPDEVKVTRIEALTPGGEDRSQLVRRNDLQLIVSTIPGLLVSPPAAELCGMPEPVALHMVVRNLNDELRTQRLPR